MTTPVSFTPSGAPELATEIRSDAPPRLAFVGEPFTLSADQAPSCTVVYSPPRSSARFNGGTFTPDRPGRYRLRVAVGDFARSDINVTVLPGEALTCEPIAHAHRSIGGVEVVSHGERSQASRRRILASIASVATDAQLEALSPTSPLPETASIPRGEE